MPKLHAYHLRFQICLIHITIMQSTEFFEFLYNHYHLSVVVICFKFQLCFYHFNAQQLSLGSYHIQYVKSSRVSQFYGNCNHETFGFHCIFPRVYHGLQKFFQIISLVYITT